MAQRKELFVAVFTLISAAVWCRATPVAAVSMDAFAAALGRTKGAEWISEFASQLKALDSEARIGNASYSTALRIFEGEAVPDSGSQAARFVFSVLLRVDRELRKGTTPAEVILETRKELARPGGGFGLQENAQTRLRRRLSNMGAGILDEVEKRPGPQSGPGASNGRFGSGSAGAGQQAGSSRAESGEQTETPY